MNIVKGISRREAFIGLSAIVALALSASQALAVFPGDSVASYAGCLNTAGSAAGTFSRVAVGNEPSSPCGANQMLIHLSGGDITSVIAGAGLSGGGTNGATTLSLAPGQSLPQTCSSGQIPEWNGTGWSCGVDNDTTYSNGTGLDLSGTTFSVSSSYRLPQSCSNGQVAKSNGSGGWTCQADIVGGTEVYYGATDAGQTIPSSGSITIGSKILLPGTYLMIGKTTMSDFEHHADFFCSLESADGTLLDSQSGSLEGHSLFESTIYKLPVALTAVVTLSTAGAIDFRCGTGDYDGLTANNTKLVAIKVATLH